MYIKTLLVKMFWVFFLLNEQEVDMFENFWSRSLTSHAWAVYTPPSHFLSWSSALSHSCVQSMTDLLFLICHEYRSTLTSTRGVSKSEPVLTVGWRQTVKKQWSWGSDLTVADMWTTWELSRLLGWCFPAPQGTRGQRVVYRVCKWCEVQYTVWPSPNLFCSCLKLMELHSLVEFMTRRNYTFWLNCETPTSYQGTLRSSVSCRNLNVDLKWSCHNFVLFLFIYPSYFKLC